MRTVVFVVIFFISLVSLQARTNYTALNAMMCKDFWDCKRCLKIKNDNKCNFGFLSGVCYKTCTGCGPYVDKMDNCTSIAKQGKCFVRATTSPFTTPSEMCEKSCCTANNTKPKPTLPYWDEWSYWGTCSKTCSNGYRKRTRVCHRADGGTYCKGYTTEYQSCNWGISCFKVDGGWSTWSKWSSCQSSCGEGKAMRSRQCSNPYPQSGGKPCNGSSEQVKTCYAGCCPEAGFWGKWSAWSSCSETKCSVNGVGSGKRERTRLCNSPKPYCGGPPCKGSRRETQRCSTPCPTASVVPFWTPWSNWGPCSKTCMKYGYRKRTRTCINRGKGDRYCVGHSREYEWCNDRIPCQSYT